MQGAACTCHVLLSQLVLVQTPVSQMTEHWGWKAMGQAPGLQGPSLCQVTRCIHHPRHRRTYPGELLGLWGEGGTDRGGRAEAGRHLDLEEGGSGLKAHVGHRHPLAAGQVGVARADTGEGGEGQDPRRQRWVWGMGPVHLIRVAERPSSGQGIHDLEGREGGRE